MNYFIRCAVFLAFFILAAVGSNLQIQAAATGGPESKVEASISFPKIDRHPCASVEDSIFYLRTFISSLLAVPHYNPESREGFQVDLRGRNLSSFDLRRLLTDLLHADFDSRMDSRTLAGYLDADEYFFCSNGGWSWCTPYVAGVYALACQVKPTITPDEFWSLAVKTGRTIEIDRKGKKAPLGPIIDPAALIDALKTN